MTREYSREMGMRTAEKVRQLEPSTTDEDSKRKLLERVSMMRSTKKVLASMVVSVVSQVVGRDGLSMVLMVRLRLLKLLGKVSVTMISPW